MKTLIFTLILSYITFSQVRIDRDHIAREELANLNFFYKGRGMVVSPDLVKLYDNMQRIGLGLSDNGSLSKRWGLNLKDNEIKGLFSIPYKNMKMGVLGCVACHSGKAAGQYIIGLGNKNIDVGQIGSDAYIAQLLWGQFPRINKPEFRELHKRAMHFVSVLKDKNITNLTQGLVPTSLIKTWFYEIQDIKIPNKFGRGQVKVPHLWGYEQKRKVGSFWDGLADGVLPGWAIAVELRGGQTVANVREYEDKIHHAEDKLSDLLPPKYPFEINQEKAKLGKQIFNKTCYRCHGTYDYDENNLPIFVEPKFVDLEVVKTDSERVDFVTDDFLELVDSNPLNDLIKYKKRNNRRIYVAPRLWGIWSRFPYLHNASVPTLMDLLSPADERPNLFDLRESGEEHRFDPKNLGLLIERDQSSNNYQELKKFAKKDKRFIYDTSRFGQKNIGHEFKFYQSLSKEDKLHLIEYLKTL